MGNTLRNTGTITAYCPECGAYSNFEHRHSIDTGKTVFYGPLKSHQNVRFGLHQCSGCLQGGLSKYTSNGNGNWDVANL